MSGIKNCSNCYVTDSKICRTCRESESPQGGPSEWVGETTEIVRDSWEPKIMEDSGKREQFDTGAIRDTAEGKSRPDLISPYAQLRKGQWLRLGAKKYVERNWEKGMKISRCIASICRHLFQYMAGKTNEDHLAAIAVNAEFIMHYEAMIEKGILPPELDDMPKYEQRIKKPLLSVDHPRYSSYCPTCREAILNAENGEAVEICGGCTRNIQKGGLK